jgi:hypothetical protein
MRRSLTILVVLVLAIAASGLITAYASARGKPSYGCSAGFDYHVTTTEAAELPRSQQAIEDGVATLEDLIAAYQAIDLNGNDMICVQETPGFFKNAQLPYAEYLYQFVDDNSSSPNGP